MSLVPGFEKKISEDFSIHIAKTIEEKKEMISVNIKVHGEDLKDLMTPLYKKHPFRDKQLWIYVKERNIDKIVCTGILLPQSIDFDGIKVPICEMGFVATLSEYRNKGLFQKVNQIYEEAMKEFDYIMSAIRGIPYYYRRFGYEFCIDFDFPITISPKKIPEQKSGSIKIYEAKNKNINELKRIYKEWSSDYSITLDFDNEVFLNKFVTDLSTELNHQTFIVEENGIVEGFFSIGKFFEEKDVISFISKLTYDQIIEVLNFLKTRKKNKTKEDNQDNDLLVLTPKISSLAKFLISIGGKIDFEWKWQVLIPNYKKFFTTLIPVLEKRIERSMYKHLTRDVYLSNYRMKVIIKFLRGKITDIICEKGYPEPSKFDMRVPNAFLNKVILGDKSIEEVHEIIQDATFKSESLPLLNVLFPKKDSYLLSYY